MLLHWATLVPASDSGLAAIRFTAPIRITFLRVFPTGAQPFPEHAPELVASTEPESFFLDVFLNALPTSPEAKDKQRAVNALVPTSIAYAGGEVDFAVDMGDEYATRLMIVKGEFKSLSLAIYGETVSDAPLDPHSYEPSLLRSPEPFPLSPAVDPSSMLSPSHVANQLLALIPDSPPLTLVIRLMFCLKPSNEDWDLPEFPYLHADLEEDSKEFNLDLALDITARPVRDDVSYDVFSTFATRVAEAVGPKSVNQAYLVAKLLANAAPQHPDMARTLLQHVDLNAVFDAQTMDDDVTLLRLLDAVSNADIARHLSSVWFFAELDKLQASPTTETFVKTVAGRIGKRIRRWAIFEDALVDTASEFSEAVQLLEDVGLEEQSIGIWLETMMTHPNIVAKLAEAPVPSERRPLTARLLRRVRRADITHADLVAFTRAYIGVASVLAVWAWTDSLGNDDCRAQTLAIIRLWQHVDGYREIVNHLLLLRQLTRRLEWITTGNVPPRKSGIVAEQILADLAQEPHAILSSDMAQAILSLNPPLAFIAEQERLSMRKVALVADDGLPAAIEELTFSSSHPLSLRRLRTIRVALAIVQRELDDPDSGEWRILEALWDEQAHGFIERLVDIFIGIGGDLNEHFGLDQPPPMNEPLLAQLFAAADDLLRLITRFTPTLPMTSRALRNLTYCIADVFACTDASAAQQYSQAAGAGADLRQTCLDLVSTLVQSGVRAESEKPAAEIVLRALLEHGSGAFSRGRDPTRDFLQALALIDHILPQTSENDDRWVTFILPNALSELGAFFRLLDPGNKVFVIGRLVKLDDGIVGIGEWLFVEEIKHLSQTLDALGQTNASSELEITRRHQAFLVLQFLSDLVNSSSSLSEWTMSTLTSVPEASKLLAMCLTTLLDGHLTSPVLDNITRVLATRAETFDSELKFALVLTSLRAFRHEPRVLLGVLKELPWDPDQDSHYQELLRLEIGQTLSTIAHTRVTSKLALTVLSIFVWLTEQKDTKMAVVCGLSSASLSQVYTKLEQALPSSSTPTLESVRSAIHVEEDDAMAPEPVELPSQLSLSLQDLESLLHPMPTPPSTPKGTSNTPDVFGVLTSPTGLLRSPAATGLTKRYNADDFRVLRQAPSARLNTSRLPSMHVDDFELASVSPMLEAFPSPNQILLQFN